MGTGRLVCQRSAADDLDLPDDAPIRPCASLSRTGPPVMESQDIPGFLCVCQAAERGVVSRVAVGGLGIRTWSRCNPVLSARPSRPLAGPDTAQQTGVASPCAQTERLPAQSHAHDPVAGTEEGPPGPNLSSATTWAARQRHGHVRDAKYQLRGIERHSAVGKLAEPGVVAGDGSLVAGLAAVGGPQVP